MKTLKAFGRFWYDFIIGDDWKIAVGVVTALGIVWAIMAATGVGDHALAVVGGITVMAAFTVTLLIDTRKRRPR